jgi:hypothetical protein
MKDVMKFSVRREADDSASYQPNFLGGIRGLPLRFIGLRAFGRHADSFPQARPD